MKKRSLKIVLIFSAVLLVLGSLYVFFGHRGGRHPTPSSQTHVHEGERRYQCPMHPHIVRDKPGKCPICHMDLQPVKKETAPAAGDEERKILYYRHPMNPRITSPAPAKDDMGMPFIPVYERSTAAGVEGRAAVDIPLGKQQLIGVKIGEAGFREIKKTIRTVGRIAYDPKLYEAQTDYLAALEALTPALESPVEGAAQRQASLVESLRLRLNLLGTSDAEIAVLEESGRPDQSLLLATEEGRLWLYADVYEQELPGIRVGQRVEAVFPSGIGRTFEGEIAAIDPKLDPRTRTARVRVRIQDPERLLRPEMYLHAVMDVDLGNRLVISRSAVLDTGKRNIIYVVTEGSHFEPREVEIGVRAGDEVEIIRGVEAGEKVVVSGNFLLDAESQLLGAASGKAFYAGEEAGGRLPGANKEKRP